MKTYLVVFLIILISSLFANDWQFLGLGKESINAIAVDWSDNSIIYAGSGSDFSAGSVGGIFKSTDGGAVWDTLVRGVTVMDIDIHPRDPEIIYATLGLNVLSTPGIIKTYDGGNSWFWADSGIKKNWETGPCELVIDPKHPDTLCTGTYGYSGGKFYKSHDGGTSWFSLGDTTFLRNGVSSIAINPKDFNIIYASVNFFGYILKSVDGGYTWEKSTMPTIGIIMDLLVDPLDTEIVYCGISYGGFYVSKDAGLTWEADNQGLQDTAQVHKIQIFQFDGKRIFYIVSNFRDNGGVYKKEMNGVWKEIGVDSNRVNTILVNENVIYCGQDGIYKKNILTGIENFKRKERKKTFLKNYPNPFNNETTIQFEISDASFVMLEVYDLGGRKINTLINSMLKPGQYRKRYTNNLASGIYLVKLRTGNKIQIKKIVLVK